MRYSIGLVLLLAVSAATLGASSVTNNKNENVFHQSKEHHVVVSTPSATTRTSHGRAENTCKEQCAAKKRKSCQFLCRCKKQCNEIKGKRRRKRCRIRCKRAWARKKKQQEQEQQTMQSEILASLTNVGPEMDRKPLYRSSPQDIIQFVLPAFDPSAPVTNYEQCADLERDIMAAVADEVVRIINQCDYDGMIYSRPTALALEDGVADSSTATKTREEVTESSFETNIQELGVDESDVLKTDGNLVHIAYGSEIVTTNATTGEHYARTSATSASEQSSNETSSSGSDEKRKISPYYSRAQVQGLLLDGCVLTAIVTGFSYDYATPFILSNGGSTEIQLYDVCNDVPTDGVSSLKLLNTLSLGGRFVDSRSINETLHVVTERSLDYWHYLNQYISISAKGFLGMNCSEYQKASANASIAYISSFSRQLLKEMSPIAGENCTNIARIRAFVSGSNETNFTVNSNLDLWGGQPLLGSLLSVNSLALGNTSETSVAAAAVPMISSAFLKGNSNFIYVSKDYLVAPTTSWSFASRSGKQSTFLMSWKLPSDGPAQGSGTGIVDGYVKDSYSIDEYDGHLRVATTSRQQQVCASSIQDDKENNDEDDDIWCSLWCCGGWVTVANSTSQVTILRLPDLPDESSDVNASTSGAMEVVSFVGGLGEGEDIKSVKFFDDFVVVVTFQTVDPLYTIDLKNNTATLNGVLKIDGYSSLMQLYPTDDDSIILLAIGQNADNVTGFDTGLQVSLFNITNMTDPQMIIRYNIENNETAQWSYSAAQFETKASRFLEESKLLLLPVQISGKPSFDGFLVLHVTPDEITQWYNVSMEDPSRIYAYSCGCHYSCASVPSRSIVISGDASFFKSHTMVNIDLTTGNENWNSTLDPEVLSKDNCCGYWLWPCTGLVVVDLEPDVEPDIVILEAEERGGS